MPTPSANTRSSSATDSGPLFLWARLVRLPNVFTVVADVSAAFLLLAHGPQPIGRLALVVAGGVALYWAGMILNDVFDIDTDRQERPQRPLVSGLIPLRRARIVAWSLMLLGVGSASASGYLPSGQLPTTFLPALIAVALAILIVLYDSSAKATAAGPVLMGGCRTLSFLLGASPLLGTADGFVIPKYVLGIAVGFGVYVMGLTQFGRDEAKEDGSMDLPMGAIITLLGAVLLAMAPTLARAPAGWHLPTRQTFPFLIGMIAFPVCIRAYLAVIAPSREKIQQTMKVGILTIIPLAAAFALLGAGPTWGLVIFALVAPSLALSARLYVT